MAAVLACGHRAVLCNASPAHHLGLLRGDGGSPVHVTAAGRRRAGQPGIRLHLPRALTRGFEKRFHAFVRCGRWLAYEPNVLVATPLGLARFDALWRGAGFALELDSWRHHGDRDAFESDRERVVAADLAGIDLKRITWRMLTGTPQVVEALLDHRVPARPI